jgi:phosphoadenosine phosphosulfate reductase
MTQLDKLERLEVLTAGEVLDQIFAIYPPAAACFTCSFQAEDVIVLDLLRKRMPRIPVLFLETGYHFA